MKISTSASIVVPKPREEVFDFCCRNETFTRHLRARMPVAGVQGAEFFEGHSLKAGDHRRITLTDGSVLDEEILDYEPPALHRYRWSKGLKGPFALLVQSGTGTWDFSEVDGGTRIDWSYDFVLKTALAYPLAFPIMPLFRAWLKQSLQSIHDELAS
jgi:uncharacterized protein YndB with AHSA1/START domain